MTYYEGKANEGLKKKISHKTKSFVSKSSSKVENLIINTEFWLLTLISVFNYGIVYSFSFIANDFYLKHILSNIALKEAKEISRNYMVLIFGLSVATVPAFGFAIDYFHKRTFWLVISNLGLYCGFSLFFFINEQICIVIIGLSFSLSLAVIWPMIMIVVDRELAVRH